MHKVEKILANSQKEVQYKKKEDIIYKSKIRK